MISKLVANAAAALADVPDGATVMIGGFGTAGQPMELIDALLEQGAKDLVIINNNAGNGTAGLAALLGANRVRKIICSFPRQVDSQIFDGLYRSGKIELELVPQGNRPNASAPPAPASAPSSRPRATARRWPRARKPAKSTAASTCWNTRCTPTTR